MKFTKKDLKYSIAAGLLAGTIAWRVFSFLDKFYIFGIPVSFLPFVIPIIWILGVRLGYFLGRWLAFFNQFGRYAAIGFTNAAVDFGVLNLEIYLSGVSSGVHYSIFKGISFLVAVTQSFFWNKYWAFEASKSREGQKEFFKFFLVNIVAFVVNVSVASFVVNFTGSQFGVTKEVWANLGAVAGSAVALIFSFIGFRMVVFRK